MSTIIDALTRRLLLESSAKLITDTTEPVGGIDHEDFEQALENCQSEEEVEQLTLEHIEKEAEIANAQPLIGGPLSDLDTIAQVDDQVRIPLTFCEPSLLPLKQYCQRILLAHLINRTRVTLLLDAESLSGLTKTMLTDIGVSLRQKIESEMLELLDDEASSGDEKNSADQEHKESKQKSKKKKLTQTTWIQFEIVVVGVGEESSTSQKTHNLLRQLKQHSIKHRVIIQGFALALKDNSVFTTNKIKAWRRKRYWQYALAHRDQSAADLNNEINQEKPKTLTVVVLGVITAIVTMAIKFALLVSFAPDRKLLVLVGFILPTIVLLIFACLQRLNTFATQHAKGFLISYLTVLAMGVISLAWPPSIGVVLYLLAVGTPTYVVNMFGALMAEAE